MNLKSNERQRRTLVENNYQIIIKGSISRLILIEYFTKYPLISSKRRDSLDWINPHNMTIDKTYKSDKGTQKLISLKSNMNNSRT